MMSDKDDFCTPEETRAIWDLDKEPTNYPINARGAAQYLGISESTLKDRRDAAKRRGVAPQLPYTQEAPGKPVFYWKADLVKAKAAMSKPRPEIPKGARAAKRYMMPTEAAALLHVPVTALAKDRTRANPLLPYTHFAKVGPAYRASVLEAIVSNPIKLWTMQQKLEGTRK